MGSGSRVPGEWLVLAACVAAGRGFAADCNENGVDGVPDECSPATPAPFRRGDADASGQLDLTDAVFVLLHLFLGGAAPPCAKAADSNDDGRLDIADPVALLRHLFVGAGPLAAPFGSCGGDPTADQLECREHEPCTP